MNGLSIVSPMTSALADLVVRRKAEILPNMRELLNLYIRYIDNIFIKTEEPFENIKLERSLTESNLGLELIHSLLCLLILTI